METVELTRDCEVTVIPGGDHVTLAAGTSVDITHSLGGTYTVRAGAGLYRVNPSDADALGKEIEDCLLYTSPSPRDRQKSRMPSSA